MHGEEESTKLKILSLLINVYSFYTNLLISKLCSSFMLSPLESCVTPNVIYKSNYSI